MNEPQVIHNSAPQLPSKSAAKKYGLTRKQKAFADHLLANPKESATAAVKESYRPTTPNSAAVIATENLRKPNILAYLNNHATKAEMVLIKAMSASKSIYKFNPETKENELLGTEDDHAIRLKAADSILDRVHGKATQRTEIASFHQVVTYDLSGGTAGQPPREVLDALEGSPTPENPHPAKADKEKKPPQP